MRYEEFKQAWSRALRESGLPVLGMDDVTEAIHLRSMDRTCESFVEPLGGQATEPFHVAASLSWRWNSLHTARTATTEEDLVRELLGRDTLGRLRTERPWLRVDVSLRASLPRGKAIPMPSAAAWANWAREAIGRLQHIEPVVPEKSAREGRGVRVEILAWHGEPVAHVLCGPGGELSLESVELSSWQAIELPRVWSDLNRKPDKGPLEQLAAMFGRVKAALGAWTEVMDHLTSRPVGS